MESKSDSANLDLLRAVAVLCVFFAHLRDQLAGTGSHTSWLFGQMGVYIFFVHTSLVLLLSLERSASRLDGIALTVDFYVRRVFRIYPLAIICVTLAFLDIVPTRAAGSPPWEWSTYIANLALTIRPFYEEEMWPVIWTLPFEMKMYLLLPLLFFFLRHRNIGWVFVGWGAAVLVAHVQPHVSGRLDFAQYMPCFIGGVLAWKMTHIVGPRWRAAWWPAAFIACSAVWLAAPRQDDELSRWTFCLLLGYTIPWFKDLRWAPLVAVARVIAKYSYGIYLAHLPILWWALTFEGPARWLMLAGLMMLVPYAAFHFVERPMIGIGRTLAARLSLHQTARALSRSATAQSL
jgi:peptidoglycan/LPS O-acetylase OafA/YrhL